MVYISTIFGELFFALNRKGGSADTLGGTQYGAFLDPEQSDRGHFQIWEEIAYHEELGVKQVAEAKAAFFEHPRQPCHLVRNGRERFGTHHTADGKGILEDRFFLFHQNDPAPLCEHPAGRLTHRLRVPAVDPLGAAFVTLKTSNRRDSLHPPPPASTRQPMKLRRKKYLTQQQTFLELLDGGQVLDANVLEKVRDFKYSQWKLFGGHLALDEPPKYKAAEFDPDIQNAVNLCIGYESLDDFDAHLKALEAGRPPEQPGMQCGVFTLFDPSQAPDGKHTALLWQVAPYDLKDGGPVHWENIKEEYLETCIARWRHYAPNLDGKNILGKATYTPYDIARSVVNM